MLWVLVESSATKGRDQNRFYDDGILENYENRMPGPPQPSHTGGLYTHCDGQVSLSIFGITLREDCQDQLDLGEELHLQGHHQVQSIEQTQAVSAVFAYRKTLTLNAPSALSSKVWEW